MNFQYNYIISLLLIPLVVLPLKMSLVVVLPLVVVIINTFS